MYGLQFIEKLIIRNQSLSAHERNKKFALENNFIVKEYIPDEKKDGDDKDNYILVVEPSHDNEEVFVNACFFTPLFNRDINNEYFKQTNSFYGMSLNLMDMYSRDYIMNNCMEKVEKQSMLNLNIDTCFKIKNTYDQKILLSKKDSTCLEYYNDFVKNVFPEYQKELASEYKFQKKKEEITNAILIGVTIFAPYIYGIYGGIAGAIAGGAEAATTLVDVAAGGGAGGGAALIEGAGVVRS